LAPHVHFILFVYDCEVCDRIQLRAGILRYCIRSENDVIFAGFVCAFVICVAFRMESGVMN
jgi:hypothetical protein